MRGFEDAGWFADPLMRPRRVRSRRCLSWIKQSPMLTFYATVRALTHRKNGSSFIANIAFIILLPLIGASKQR
jgi:hypothetical protein